MKEITIFSWALAGFVLVYIYFTNNKNNKNK